MPGIAEGRRNRAIRNAIQTAIGQPTVMLWSLSFSADHAANFERKNLREFKAAQERAKKIYFADLDDGKKHWRRGCISQS
jgi:hypothetical protein